ncbi:pyrimidine/purine-5'-nucleotide nucleosidase [uncultured bacterium]|nr:pyrimidine/purine-5'-nucleotide nucleosidase [uncultured bacterium]
MNQICVFCGSNPGADPEYIQATRELGRVLAARHLTLIYGGARVGMMGELANSVLEAGGQVIGVIPQSLADKVAHTGLSDLRIVNSMHERKALMAELADGFVVLPGGFGTLEEFFEVLTWSQLGLHHKPCGLLNVNQYYQRLAEFLDYAVTRQFIKAEHRDMLLIDDDPGKLLDKFDDYQPPLVDKWAA